MYVGILELDVLLGEVDSLKYKRAVIRPIIARLRRLEVAVTEAGDPDRRRAVRSSGWRRCPENTGTFRHCWTGANARWRTRWRSSC